MITNLLQISNKKLKYLILTSLNHVHLLINNSKIPSECPQKSNESLSFITFEINDTEKIIKNLDPNKSHGHDMLSIRMLKLCGESIYKPYLVQILFRNWSISV